MSTSEEVWADIKGYEGLYKVSNTGRVLSLEKAFQCGQQYCVTKTYSEKVMKLSVVDGGYLAVGLRKNGKCIRYLVHRLVAMAFIPNPKRLRVVDHVNSIRSDNRSSNLRWFSYKQSSSTETARKNMSKAQKGLLKSMKYYIEKIDPYTMQVVGKYRSSLHAASHNDISTAHILLAARQYPLLGKGFYWRKVFFDNGPIKGRDFDDSIDGSLVERPVDLNISELSKKLLKKHRWNKEPGGKLACLDCGCVREKFHFGLEYTINGRQFRYSPGCIPVQSTSLREATP